jgi:glycosyltransferase involved in cell wall biosynthesis
MRVLHLAPFLWSGAGNVITRLVIGQARHHDVTLVTTPEGSGLSNWRMYERRLVGARIPHRRLDLFHRDADAFWTTVGRLRKAIAEIAPDLIHAHAGPAVAAAALARAKGRPSLIAQFYSWGLGRPEWMNVMDGWAFAQADMVVCSAANYADLLVAHGVARRRLRLVPWGLPLDDLKAHAGRRSPAMRIIGTVGRIEPRKGQLQLVEAFASLRKSHADVRLEIVGPVADARYARRVSEAVRRLGVPDQVRITGHVRDPARNVARWAAYVSLSQDEGQGLAVLEAMALGVPVVALRVSGIADYLVDGRNGVVLPNSQPRVVAKRVGDLLDTPERAARLARQARALVERRYAWPRTVEAFDRLYARVVKRAR